MILSELSSFRAYVSSSVKWRHKILTPMVILRIKLNYMYYVPNSETLTQALIMGILTVFIRLKSGKPWPRTWSHSSRMPQALGKPACSSFATLSVDMLRLFSCYASFFSKISGTDSFLVMDRNLSHVTNSFFTHSNVDHNGGYAYRTRGSLFGMIRSEV